MFNLSRKFVRQALSTVLVTVPSAYILWEWAHVDDPIAPGLSYSSFNARLSGADAPSFWTYALWILLVFLAMLLVRAMIHWLLLRVFPDPQGKAK